ncbi:MAG: hypothetical protein IJT38_01225 [Clostridia bacterium]|nr:hypothetical protein [Clostridia bacterium]
MRKKIIIMGGDLRLSYAASYLADKNYETVYFRGSADENTIKRSGILLLGVPVSSDGETLNAPLSEDKIYLNGLAESIDSDTILIGGKIPENIFKCRTYDLLKRDDFAYYNAVPTAEGVLETAMRETNYCISQSKCLVIGYGRIGKVICDMLGKLGTRVTVSARKASDMALAEALGHKAENTLFLKNFVGDYDIIINTVPQKILNAEVLERTSPDSLIIDTASKPGGVDTDEAFRLSRKVVCALSLPGKVAPKTAGEIIGRTTQNILDELGE